MARLFVKVYYEDLSRDYPTVYDDAGALSTWLRLLVIEDKMWPSPPVLPRTVRPRALAILTKAGLVQVDKADRYHVKGYRSERLARQDAAAHAAAMRWHSKSNAAGNADAYAETMPTRARAEVRGQSTEVRDSLRENGGSARGGKPERAFEVATKMPLMRPRGT